jgi:hypothetical protein
MLTWPGLASHMRLQIPTLPAAACPVPSLPEFPPGYPTPGSSPYSGGPGLLHPSSPAAPAAPCLVDVETPLQQDVYSALSFGTVFVNPCQPPASRYPSPQSGLVQRALHLLHFSNIVAPGGTHRHDKCAIIPYRIAEETERSHILAIGRHMEDHGPAQPADERHGGRDRSRIQERSRSQLS